MNWFKDFFPLKNILHDSSEAGVTDTLSKKQARILLECVECTAPIAESNEPLDFVKIQQFVPLRHLDKQAISGLAHKTLTYAEQSVILIYEQTADYVYYLLAGTVTVLPNA
ncbi:MAG: hypothetical protein DRQ62_04560, partial [Gammaproteobacteria bacterium]